MIVKFTKKDGSVKVTHSSFKKELEALGWEMEKLNDQSKDYDKMKVDELKAFLINDGFEVDAIEGLKKQELLALIKG